MFSSFLNQFVQLGNHDSQLIENAVVIKEVPKNTCLLKEGAICQSLYFIQSGSFIQYNNMGDISPNIIDLHLESEWMLNQQSFISQKSSTTIIQAFTNAVVYELSMQKMHELISQSPAFFQLARLLEPVPSRLPLFDNQLTPLQKYQFVLEHRPGLLHAFPLKIIASYLKIAPETLSRAREKIYKGKNVS